MLFPTTARIYTGVFQRASFTGNERALTLKALLKELMLQSLAFTFTPSTQSMGTSAESGGHISGQGRDRDRAGGGCWLAGVLSDLKVWPKSSVTPGSAPLLGSPVQAGNGFLSCWGAGAGGSFRSASKALALLTSTPAPPLKVLRGWESWLMSSRSFLPGFSWYFQLQKNQVLCKRAKQTERGELMSCLFISSGDPVPGDSFWGLPG